MQRLALAACVQIALAAALFGCAGDSGSTDSRGGDRFDGERAFSDLQAQVQLGPRPSGSAGARREVRLIVSQLGEAGVPEVQIQRPLANVVATIPGSKPGVVVAGAHYDTKDVPGFVGANDGASGVAVLLELARSLPPRLDGPSLQLVFFDGEESRGDRDFSSDGIRGSRQYVAYAQAGGRQGSAPLAQIEAMVLFDMVGDCDLRIPLEQFSDRGLYRDFANAAANTSEDGSRAPFTGTSPGVLDDQIPFREAGVPVLDLIDFEYGPGLSPGAYWHTRQDTVRHTCADSLDAVGEASVEALQAIGR